MAKIVLESITKKVSLHFLGWETDQFTYCRHLSIPSQDTHRKGNTLERNSATFYNKLARNLERKKTLLNFLPQIVTYI